MKIRIAAVQWVDAAEVDNDMCCPFEGVSPLNVWSFGVLVDEGVDGITIARDYFVSDGITEHAVRRRMVIPWGMVERKVVFEITVPEEVGSELEV